MLSAPPVRRKVKLAGRIRLDDDATWLMEYPTLDNATIDPLEGSGTVGLLGGEGIPVRFMAHGCVSVVGERWPGPPASLSHSLIAWMMFSTVSPPILTP